ncbi:T9SS type A sorting domain-containing protein, partial [Candidatus Latescibacterota bacterium]
TVYTYDEQGNRTESFRQTPIGNEWINLHKDSYTCDEQGNEIEWFTYSWENNEWINRAKVSSSFDNQGNLTEKLYQHWVDGEWRNFKKFTDTYDEQGNLTGVLRQDWNGDKWDTMRQEANTFDDQGHMTEKLTGSPTVEIYTMEIFTYDDQWQKIEMHRLFWIEEREEWNPTWKTTYTNDDSGNLTAELLLSWEVEGEEWSPYEKTTYTYNAQGILTNEHRQRLRDGEWISVKVEASTYDEQGRRTEWIRQIFSEGELFNSYRYLYSYDYITYIAENSSDMSEKILLTSNYPNPFNPSTTISYSLPQNSHITLSIYNISGQRVSVLKDEYQLAGSYSTTWDAIGFPSGHYFYILEARGYTQTRRMVLVK